jgi:hypothetical protein
LSAVISFLCLNITLLCHQLLISNFDFMLLCRQLLILNFDFMLLCCQLLISNFDFMLLRCQLLISKLNHLFEQLDPIFFHSDVLIGNGETRRWLQIFNRSKRRLKVVGGEWR